MESKKRNILIPINCMDKSCVGCSFYETASCPVLESCRERIKNEDLLSFMHDGVRLPDCILLEQKRIDSKKIEVTRPITAPKLAKICGADLKTIHNWVKNGSLIGFRTPGRHLRFKRSEIDVFLAKYGFGCVDWDAYDGG